MLLLLVHGAGTSLATTKFCHIPLIRQHISYLFCSKAHNLAYLAHTPSISRFFSAHVSRILMHIIGTSHPPPPMPCFCHSASFLLTHATATFKLPVELEKQPTADFNINFPQRTFRWRETLVPSPANEWGVCEEIRLTLLTMMIFCSAKNRKIFSLFFLIQPCNGAFESKICDHADYS